MPSPGRFDRNHSTGQQFDRSPEREQWLMQAVNLPCIIDMTCDEGKFAASKQVRCLLCMAVMPGWTRLVQWPLLFFGPDVRRLFASPHLTPTRNWPSAAGAAQSPMDLIDAYLVTFVCVCVCVCGHTYSMTSSTRQDSTSALPRAPLPTHTHVSVCPAVTPCQSDCQSGAQSVPCFDAPG